MKGTTSAQESQKQGPCCHLWGDGRGLPLGGRGRQKGILGCCMVCCFFYLCYLFLQIWFPPCLERLVGHKRAT